MKKLLNLIAIVVLGAGTAFAQATVTVPAPKQAVKTANAAKATSAVAKKEVKTVQTKVVATKNAATNAGKVVTTKTSANAVKLKADGTPDMRYAENKTKKVVVTGPKKKDGTADMRYKVNQAAAKKN